MTVTDEMVEKARIAWGDVWAREAASRDAVWVSEAAIRAALEAVAPALIAQELRRMQAKEDIFDQICQAWLRNRAQELDPK